MAGLAGRPARDPGSAAADGGRGRADGDEPGLFVVLFVVFVAERLGGGAAEVGLLRGVQAVGGLLGGLLVGVLARKLAPGRLLGVAVLSFGVVAALGWNGPYVTTAMVFYVAAFVVVGVPGVIAGAGMMSVLQLHTADEVRGRVIATFVSLSDGGQALGMVLAGVLTPVLGLSVLLNAQAALYLAAGVLVLATVDARPLLSRRAR
ncbi:MFS transporter [Saccharothrix sp. ALI-22-I]|uniref:MFS transporter n=1 Tax=Saccharothrix sp. ALI-22-I TaxID=1933778 RepID=UPI000A03F719